MTTISLEQARYNYENNIAEFNNLMNQCEYFDFLVLKGLTTLEDIEEHKRIADILKNKFGFGVYPAHTDFLWDKYDIFRCELEMDAEPSSFEAEFC